MSTQALLNFSSIFLCWQCRRPPHPFPPPKKKEAVIFFQNRRKNKSRKKLSASFPSRSRGSVTLKEGGTRNALPITDLHHRRLHDWKFSFLFLVHQKNPFEKFVFFYFSIIWLCVQRTRRHNTTEEKAFSKLGNFEEGETAAVLAAAGVFLRRKEGKSYTYIYGFFSSPTSTYVVLFTVEIAKVEIE